MMAQVKKIPWANLGQSLLQSVPQWRGDVRQWAGPLSQELVPNPPACPIRTHETQGQSSHAPGDSGPSSAVVILVSS